MKGLAISTAIIVSAISLHSWRQADSQAHQLPLVMSYAMPAGDVAASAASSTATAVAEPGAVISATQPSARPNVLTIPGRVQPRTKVTISSRTSLPVVDVPFREGDRVTKGDLAANVPASVLVRLDEADLQAALRTAEAKRDAQATDIAVAQIRMSVQESQIAAAKIALGEAERQWGRVQQLIASGDTSAASADEANTRFERAKTDFQAVLQEQQASRGHLKAMQQTLAAAEAEVERAKVALAAATIVSPIDGVITRVNVRPGEMAVTADGTPGTTLLEVADMERMLLVGRADEEIIAKLTVGQQVSVRLKGYGDEPFAGKIERIALVSTEDQYGTAHFRTEISLETRGRMIPAGVSGEARIEPASPDSRG